MGCWGNGKWGGPVPSGYAMGGKDAILIRGKEETERQLKNDDGF